jgi:hypothetical protein
MRDSCDTQSILHCPLISCGQQGRHFEGEGGARAGVHVGLGTDAGGYQPTLLSAMRCERPAILRLLGSLLDDMHNAFWGRAGRLEERQEYKTGNAFSLSRRGLPQQDTSHSVAEATCRRGRCSLG